jgi:hypothetical protein
VDTAYWFSWYDVPEENRAEYLAWLNERYIPAVLNRTGVLWAAHYRCIDSPAMSGAPGRFRYIDNPAVPQGKRYILGFGAARSRAFLDPTAAEFHAALGSADKAMLERRQGTRSSVLIEDARIEGAEASRYPDLAPAIQMGSFNAEPDFEDEACAWLSRQRLAALPGMEGVVRARTMVAVTGWGRHAIFYEFPSLEARGGLFLRYEKGHPELEAWTDRVSRRWIHMPGSPAVAERIWPAPAHVPHVSGAASQGAGG